MRRALLRFVITAATAIAVVAIATTPATAAVDREGGFRYVTKQFEVTTETNKTFKAPCPDGTHVYSGGYYNTSSFDHGYVIHSFPYDGNDRKSKPDDGWKARVLTRNPPVSWKVYAVCAKPMPRYKHLRIELSGATGTRGVGYSCQSGLNVFSGGTRGDDLLIEVQSYPTVGTGLRQWSIELDSFTDDPTVLHLYAVCANLNAGYPDVSDTAPPYDQEGTSVDCPGELPHVVGGGVSNDGPFGRAVLPASRPVGFAAGTDAWEGYVDNYDTNNTNTNVGFKVWAVCSGPVN